MSGLREYLFEAKGHAEYRVFVEPGHDADPEEMVAAIREEFANALGDQPEDFRDEDGVGMVSGRPTVEVTWRVLTEPDEARP